MEKPQVGETYRHFKGHYYEIVGFAYSSENAEELVLYKECRFNGDVWARTLTEFTDIHPKHNVKRFEKMRVK